MKLAIFHELDSGGAKRVVFEFPKRLNKIFDVDLYYVSEKLEKDTNNYFKNTFFYPFYPRYWNGDNWKTKLYKDTVELIKLYKLHQRIAEEIKLKKYDFIFVHPSKFTQAPFLLQLLRNQCIYYCQEPLRIVYDPNLSSVSHIKFPKNIYEYIIRKIRKQIDLKNFKSAKIIVANSLYSKKFIEKSYHRLAEICYPGVDTDFFKPSNLDKTIDVLFIGNKNKEYNLLIQSLDLFKTKPKLYSIFRNEKNLSISDKELVKIYNKSKVLVALNKSEPFGLIPLESMACGTPVIAINEGGYKESIIDNESGFLISNDFRILYKRISKIINNEKLRNKMAKNSRENVLKNWRWEKGTKRSLEIINYGKR